MADSNRGCASRKGRLVTFSVCVVSQMLYKHYDLYIFAAIIASRTVFDHLVGDRRQTRRRQSFSCRRCTCVERFAAVHNIHILSVYFSQTSEDSSLPALLPFTVCVVPEQWLLSFSDTLIVRVTYFLTCYVRCYLRTNALDYSFKAC